MSKSVGERRFQIGINSIMAVIATISVIPIILLIIASFTDAIALYGYSFFPKEWSLEAYSYLWIERAQIFRAYFITIVVTAVGTTLAMCITLLYGYALSIPAFPGKSFFALFIFIPMLFNGGLVPTYIMYTRYLGVKNTILGLIVPSLLMNAFNVILVRTYIQSNVPYSMTEAAKIDGAGEFMVLGKVVLPLMKPIVATVGLFIGIGYWNDWTNGLYYITEPRLYSIQQLLNNMMRNIEYLSKNANTAVNLNTLSNNIPSTTVRMAIAVVGILPILIVYPFVQKYFVKGITVGAVKG